MTNKIPLTVEQLKKIMPRMTHVKEWLGLMNEILPKYGIDTKERLAMFLAQTAHESNEYRTTSENLNYSAAGLNRVFSKYFKKAGRNAKNYARKPERIANLVYANRLGNGPESSGDGYRYRGKGIIQLTGKANHKDFAKHMGMDLGEVEEYLDTKKGALESAAWFWETRGLNKIADEGDIRGATKKINGGYNGLKERQMYYERAKHVLDGDTDTREPVTGFASMGDRGEFVAQIQRALGIDDDGIFGPNTKRAVKEFQMKNGLVADGVVGPQTANVMFSK